MMGYCNKGRITNLQSAMTEANRCLLCFDAPCSRDCGADTDPAKFIRQLRFGNIKGAVRTIRRNNILGAVCAFVCPTGRLCVKGCTRSDLDVPIRIGEIQAFLMDYERSSKMQVLKPVKQGEKSVAIIGSGPAGLSTAACLAQKGYKTTIFEKAAKPGGILMYGIPSYRLHEDILDYELDLLKSLGIEFRCGENVLGEKGLQKLFEKGFDAIFLSTGLDAPFSLSLVESSVSGIYSWEEFLGLMKEPGGSSLVKGKDIIIAGGGNVALDCATSAKFFGANRVYCISLESMEELPADEDEIHLAIDKGVRFRPNSRITKIMTEKQSVKGITGEEIEWVVPGRLVPENAQSRPGSEFSLPVDMVIEALGTGISKELLSLFTPLDKSGDLVRVNPETLQTSNPRIFAGGDLAGKGKTVGACVADGKKAAKAIAEAFPITSPGIQEHPGHSKLKVEFCGIHFPNPFCLSSSPVSNTAEMIARAFEAGWGGAIYKTLNLEKDFPIIDPTPRLNALHYGEKRMIGLQNIEMISERPFEQNLKDIAWLKQHFPDRVLIASIMGYSSEGWIELACGAQNAGADMLELNFSCPQMAREDAGHKVGQSYDLIEEYTRAVKDHASIPVMAKMTPNITDMIPVAIAAKKGGADAISAINTLRSITEVDLDSFSPKPSIQGKGSISGYSGTSVKPIALRFIGELAQNKELGLPVSGIGGIETWMDAAMFLLMGAATVQATTSVMHYGYRIIEDLVEGLCDYLDDKEFASIQDIIGMGLRKLVEPSEHHQSRHVISEVNQDKCIGCGLCHISCGDGANQAMKFDPEKRKAEVDEERCVGCLLCCHVCPVWDCISIKESDRPIAGGMHETALNFINK